MTKLPNDAYLNRVGSPGLGPNALLNPYLAHAPLGDPPTMALALSKAQAPRKTTLYSPACLADDRPLPAASHLPPQCLFNGGFNIQKFRANYVMSKNTRTFKTI